MIEADHERREADKRRNVEKEEDKGVPKETRSGGRPEDDTGGSQGRPEEDKEGESRFTE